MADKLENLVNRLEKTTGRLESIQTDKLESLVDRLEKAIGKIDPTGVSGAVQVKSPVQSQPQTSKAPAFNAFDSVYNELEEKAKASGNQDLINLTNIALQVFRWTDAIISVSTTAKKPNNDIVASLQRYVGERAKEINQNYVHPRKLENHAKAVKEGLGAVLWIYTDGPASYIDGVIEPTTYNLNKVKMQKIAGEPEWADKFLNVLKAFKVYSKENYSTGLIWKGKQEGDFSQLAEGVIPEAGSSQNTQASTPSQATTTNVSAQPQSANAATFNAFDSIYNDLEEKAKASGNQDLVSLTNITLQVFRWTDAIIALSTTSKKPNDEVSGNLQKYVREKGKEIEQNYIHPRKLENHAKAIKEGLGAVFWIYTDGPASYIDGVMEPVMYSANKVKMQKVAAETEWVDKYLAVLRKFKVQTVIEYVKENFSTGLIWKGKQEGDFSQLVQGKLPGAESTSTPSQSTSSHPEQPNRAALFSELNKGSAVTQGLKVADRKPKGQISEEPPLQPLAKTTTAPTQQASTKVAEVKPAKTPKKYFKDNWFFENYTDDKTIVLEEADMKEGVYIDNCHKSVIQIRGKVKSVMISNCSNFGLVFDSVVSTVESVNTKGLTIQVKVHAPSIVLDKCERVKVYLAKDLATDIVSSKVSELNVSYLLDDDDYAKEFPVTEQFLTRWDPKAGKFVTKPLDIFM